MHRIRSLFVVPALVLAVSACFSHPAGARSADGTVSGTLALEGGAAPGTARTLIPGTVELSVHGRRVVTIHVPMTGTFRARVPVGKYEAVRGIPVVPRVAPSPGGREHSHSVGQGSGNFRPEAPHNLPEL